MIRMAACSRCMHRHACSQRASSVQGSKRCGSSTCGKVMGATEAQVPSHRAALHRG